MCFYNDNDDYDWCAEIHEVARSTAGGQSKCIECGAAIADGEWREHIFQQESCGECLSCEAYPDDDEDACQCEAPDLGNTFEADTCRKCYAIIAAIRRQERDEGCPVHAQRPGVGELADVFFQHDNRMDYAIRAVRLFPSLADHKFVRAAIHMTLKCDRLNRAAS